MVSIEKKFLFIHVPKTGGNSIQSLLERYSEDSIVTVGAHQDGIERFELSSLGGELSKHATLLEYKRSLQAALYKELFKFSVIRNPWERVASYYFSPHAGRTEWDAELAKNLIKKMHPLRYYILEGTIERKLGSGWRRLGIAGELDSNIDALIRFEHIEKDFAEVCERIGVPADALPRRNASKRNSYKDYYSEELARIVRSKFAEEIEFGSYDF